ncbi:hypothetical protein D6833_01335 [Candidatus Parcubacteria bacterium]|nr:MAG: hypothetical protein D6833_01335 [Candidatus Parcubacteria bacterium]
MKYQPVDPPRVFQVGFRAPVLLRDCARIELAPDEQVTFVTNSGAEYDVVRKDWGFYATPSLNGRLQQFGLRAVLVRNELAKFYILLVESGKEAAFQQYVEQEGLKLICWLDSTSALKRLQNLILET